MRTATLNELRKGDVFVQAKRKETTTSINKLEIKYDHKPVKKEMNEDGTFKFGNTLLKSDDNGFVKEVITGKQRPELRYDSKTGQLFNVFCRILKGFASIFEKFV